MISSANLKIPREGQVIGPGRRPSLNQMIVLRAKICENMDTAIELHYRGGERNISPEKGEDKIIDVHYIRITVFK